MSVLGKFFVAACIAGVAGGAPGATAASHYSAVRNFTVKANPNGVWSYLDSDGLLTRNKRRVDKMKGLELWANHRVEPHSVVVLANHTGAPGEP